MVQTFRTKMIRLMEVTGRHGYINILFEKQIHCKESFSFGFLESALHENITFKAMYDMISLKKN